MKRMIRYGMKPVRYRIVVINVLLALALTLLVNFSFFLIGADPRGLPVFQQFHDISVHGV